MFGQVGIIGIDQIRSGRIMVRVRVRDGHGMIWIWEADGSISAFYNGVFRAARAVLSCKVRYAICYMLCSAV